MKKQKTIVIAEDSPTQAVQLQFILEKNNYTVYWSKNGKQALELIKEEKPDIIITDIMMPEMDGFELTKLVKEDSQLSDIPIILVTALSGLTDVLKGLESGAENYIIKPFEEVDLMSKIETVLNTHSEGITEFEEGNLIIAYDNYSYYIDSKSTKIADFLITTYENVLKKNKVVEETQNELRILNESLEEKVKERTSELLKEVTERKQYQYALEESEKKYRFLFNNAPDGIIQIDSKGTIVNCNKRESELVGYKKEEIIGKHLTFFENRESTEKFEKRLIDLQNAGYLEAEVFLYRKNGTVFPVWRKVSAIYNDDGDFTGAIIHTRDITARLKAEKALKERMKELKCLYKISRLTEEKEISIEDILKKTIEIIPNSMQYPEITYSKLIFEKSEFITSNFSDTSWKQKSDILINGRKKGILEIGYLKEMAEEDEGPFLKEEGNLINTICKLLGSIIERMLAKEQLAKQNLKYQNLNEAYEVQNEELIQNMKTINNAYRKLEIALEHAKESDRLKTAFLQNMSHEIRTPMNCILGFTSLLKEPDLNGEQQQEYIDLIKTGGDRMLNTVNDLMDISMIESNQMKIFISETNVNKQIENLYNFFEPEVERKGMQFSFYNSLPDHEAHIQTDQTKFFAILTNLIKNAIKFTHKGIIEFGYNKKDNDLEFFIKDTGIGIPNNRQMAIFDRFVQADIEDKNVHEGAGLGLSISKAFIEMLGGRIWVESNEGKGSQFYFTIPYNLKTDKEAMVMEKTSESKIENYIGGLKILIAEDVEAADTYLSIVVKNIGKEILHAKTGTETIVLCRENQDIDLVLMDIKMPVMSGYKATRKIREFNKDVVIIAQTAYALAGDREKALDAGCDDYISKPIKKDKLMEIIKKHVL